MYKSMQLLIGCVTAVVIFSVTAWGKGSEMMIIAHRGASRECPENTLAAVKRAWEIGADAVEIDVHLSADRKLVVIHDSTTSRTTGRDYVVSETLSSVLCSLDAGAWKGASFRGEKVPLLEEVLATVPKGKTLFVEIKSSPETVGVLKKVLERSKAASQVVLISFDLKVIEAASRELPNIRRYWLRGTLKDEATSAPLPHPATWISMAKAAGAHGLDLHHAGMTADFVKAVREAGMELYVWTVNDPEIAKQMHALQCDGLTTDDPRAMLKLFGRAPKTVEERQR
ncbi:MAG: glycerophosphodiester phosphodiesterase [Candidatus Hydrogenedentota bacterium]|uniref:Glycerophosphoryl diester phosphodiesterase n=1 Tax=Sumerlaea chitinivorans TaxID=2250252 RepID=A0A2Z4Y405_SUMC1|nr:Glycerophosphoryl diester phosphodiesterase [Candidatus Sumerlaea chitinivorans]RMH25410.1 MAG: glycerophosphodiester phosphodiesterase [Candidatus Hydrogenedentota bacterium]GIX44318.1 MAG: glycerophosphoryl diester phosphodiesterase [Candidatus Sumerlaea sp.]